MNASPVSWSRTRQLPLPVAAKLGVYVPTRRKRPKTAEISELKAAAERLASALADVDEEQQVNEFKELRRRGKDTSR